MQGQFFDFAVEMSDEHFWVAIAAGFGAIGAGFNFISKRLSSRNLKVEMSDGTKVEARFQTQQGNFIETLVNSLRECNDRHQECIDNYQRVSQRMEQHFGKDMGQDTDNDQARMA